MAEVGELEQPAHGISVGVSEILDGEDFQFNEVEVPECAPSIRSFKRRLRTAALVALV